MSPPDPVLIHFDRKARVFLGLLLVTFALATAFKLHGSSLAIWNRVLPDLPLDAGVLLGTPRAIRGDEWGVTTLAIVSQARSQPSFPLANPGWGPEEVPLIFNLPARHWSMLLRPQFWGFFVLDLERAFAFHWNMKALLLVGGVFLLLMLLTGSDFGVSLLGSAWVFVSGFMQWWYSTPAMLPEMVGCVGLLLVAAHYLVLSDRKWVIGASTAVFSICVLDAALSLYPPFQVPLFYLGIAIGIGSLGPRLAEVRGRDHLAFRVCCSALALSTVALLLARYYYDAKPTMGLMLGTVYPGARTSSGGDVSVAQVFSGFYGFFMSEGSYPGNWFNVCEASNFALLFPVPLVVSLWRAWKRQPVTALEWSLAAYLILVLVWLTVGWPHLVAVASGFGLSQGTRSLLGLGLGSIVACCVFLAKPRVDVPGGIGRQLGVAASLVALLALYALDFNRVTGGFATPVRVAVVSLVVAAAACLLLARRRILFAAFILVPGIWSHGLVNPVAVGLGPILDTNLFQQVSALVERDPDARWTVYGSYAIADLLKATGARVWNGTKIVPPLEDLRMIDAGPSSESIYNRYAHIELVPVRAPGASFRLLHGDSYAIAIDPKSDLWRRLGIRYVALPFEATDREFLGRTVPVLALPDVGLWIYRYE